MREHVKSWTKKDFKVEWFSGTGAGGQHRNKHQNCCRITHIESGMQETGQNHRERARNQKEAFTRLAHRVVNAYKKENERIKVISKDVVRSYNEPDNRIKDHASGVQVPYKDLDAKLDMLMTERMLALKGKDESKS